MSSEEPSRPVDYVGHVDPNIDGQRVYETSGIVLLTYHVVKGAAPQVKG